MKRILMTLALALVMAAMMVVLATPAFAKVHLNSPSQSECNSGRGNGFEFNPFECDPSTSVKFG